MRVLYILLQLCCALAVICTACGDDDSKQEQESDALESDDGFDEDSPPKEKDDSGSDRKNELDDESASQDDEEEEEEEAESQDDDDDDGHEGEIQYCKYTCIDQMMKCLDYGGVVDITGKCFNGNTCCRFKVDNKDTSNEDTENVSDYYGECVFDCVADAPTCVNQHMGFVDDAGWCPDKEVCCYQFPVDTDNTSGDNDGDEWDESSNGDERETETETDSGGFNPIYGPDAASSDLGATVEDADAGLLIF